MILVGRGQPMTQREAFIRAIAEDPADDAHRLVFADWLDDHDEATLAEFIRVQMNLGDVHRDKPPRKLARMVARERQLLEANEKTWLGVLEPINDEVSCHAVFRRGFVASLAAEGGLLSEYADAIARHCPVVEELDVVGIRGHGKQLAKCAFFAPVRTLRLEDWPLPSDTTALAASPHLARVERLSVWLGSRNDRAVCKALGAARNLTALRQVELIQLFGGMQAGDDAGRFAERADEMAEIVNDGQGRPIAVVSRPFETLMPLGPYVGRDLYGGTLPDGRQVLAHNPAPHHRDETYNWEFFYFEDGRLVGAERRRLRGDSPAGRNKPPYRFRPVSASHEVTVEWLWQAIGYRPATVRVREFRAETFLPGHDLAIYKFGRGAYDAFSDPDGDAAWDDPGQTSNDVRDWLRGGIFVVSPRGSECWADESGTIVAT